ncbi:shematrin-like protein 1 [Drosophila madeirensis]|uniref:Shematrin-like protein 1 n=1 Tax=Drosophila madeirensis TaxID=30013 RepID=A0AAU9F0Y8_DROMD
MRATYSWPLASLAALLLLLRGTHLTGASVVSIGAAVDKEVAPVGAVTTDLLSLEPEIGGSAVRPAQQRGGRRARGIFFSGGFTGYPFGYGWSLPGQGYGYGYGYGSYGLPPTYYGYYPGYLGYQKIIIG